MGLINAFTGAIGGTFADQWKDIITVESFDEKTAVSPGIFQGTNNNRGENTKGSEGVITNGSKIFIPENMAAFIFSQSGIEEIITTPGGYEYSNGEESVFNQKSGILNADVKEIGKILFKNVSERMAYGGQPSEIKKVAFINLREIRDIKFGTRGPLVYHDLSYGTDLEILAFGTFSLKITNPEKFVRNFLPPNVYTYSFSHPNARSQIISEFIQSFVVALNSLSTTYRISQIPALANEIVTKISEDSFNAGTWEERFGIEIVKVGIESIEFSHDSKELVKQYSATKMNLRAYEGVSQDSSNIVAQQKIAGGVYEHGLGEGGGMMFGMNMVQGMNPQNANQPVSQNPSQENQRPAISFDEQIEAVKKLKDLLETGILSQEEFEQKKKEIMGL